MVLPLRIQKCLYVKKHKTIVVPTAPVGLGEYWKVTYLELCLNTSSVALNHEETTWFSKLKTVLCGYMRGFLRHDPTPQGQVNRAVQHPERSIQVLEEGCGTKGDSRISSKPPETASIMTVPSTSKCCARSSLSEVASYRSHSMSTFKQFTPVALVWNQGCEHFPGQEHQTHILSCMCAFPQRPLEVISVC